jgi:hypothetical protein
MDPQYLGGDLMGDLRGDLGVIWGGGGVLGDD